jgi:PAS domain S-box-containing protein
MLLSSHLRRKALVGRLAENEERLRRALQAGRQGIYDVDVSAGMVTVDAEYARVLGFDPATNGERVADWIGRLHADDRARADAHYRDYVAGRLPEYRVEFRMRMGDGSWRWVLSVGRIVARDPSGMPMRMLGTHTDITAEKEAAEKLCLAQAQSQRLIAEGDQSRLALLSVVEDLKAAEDSLVESEAFYRGLFENMHEGFAYCRMIHKDGQPHDFVYLRVNASFEQMRAIAHATNRRASEVLPDFPAANPELFAAYARVAASGTAEVLEVNIVRLSRWFLVSVFCPHPDHFVSAWIDITEKKRTEIDNRERLEELSRWYKATLGRESRVIELKSEVNDLLRRLGEPPRYSPAPATRNGEPG